MLSDSIHWSVNSFLTAGMNVQIVQILLCVLVVSCFSCSFFFFIKGNSYIEQKGKQKRVNLFFKKKKTFLLPMAEALKIIFKLFSVEQLCFIM